jgi:hypothetical protein
MLPLDYVHALILVGVALYVWQREPPRILLTPLMLISFFVLYGAGNIVYFAGAETIPEIHNAVTLSMILMWISLLVGIELARACTPASKARFEQVTRSWKSTPLVDRHDSDRLLIAVGVATAAYLIGVFLYLGKPSQVLDFVSLQSAADKAKYRHDFGSDGGYVYQTLIASVAPFLSFLFLLKGAVSRRPYVLGVGALICVAVLAGKLGIFQKSPWVVYLLQLIVVWQMARSLQFGVGRALILALVTVGGVVLAVTIALPQIDWPDLMTWLTYRFFEVNNEGIYQTYYVYPQYLPHTWGMNIGLIHSIFENGDLVPAYSRVASLFGAEGATFDVFFIGDAWVDFSYGGVIVMSLIVGFVVKMVDVFAISLGKRPVTVALLGSGMYGLFQLEVNSAFTAFLSGGLLVIPLVVAASFALMNDLSRPAGKLGANPTSP